MYIIYIYNKQLSSTINDVSHMQVRHKIIHIALNFIDLVEHQECEFGQRIWV